MSELLTPPQLNPLVETDLERSSRYMEQTRINMAQGLIGRSNEAAAITDAVFADQDTLLNGPPGLGKTELVNNFISLFKKEEGQKRLFGRFQGTADKLPAEVLGSEVYDPRTGLFYVKHGPIDSHFLFFDEINRANGRTQSAVNEAAQEGQVTIGNEIIQLPNPFIILATKNDHEFGQATEPMSDALTDRFGVNVEFVDPSIDEREKVAKAFAEGRNNPVLPQFLTIDGLRRVQEIVKSTNVNDEAINYLSRVVQSLVELEDVELVSTGHRSVMSAVRMAQANAVRTKQAEAGMTEMTNILPLVLTHRVKSKDDGATASDRQAAVSEAIKKVA